MKKIISLLIVVAMLAGMVPAVFADVGVVEDNVFVLDATEDLEAFAQGDKADGDTLVVNDYFTVVFSAKTKVDGSNKTFEDGYVASQRLNFGGKTQEKNDVLVNIVWFTTSAPATVKLWWVSGGEGRTMAIYSADGDVLQSDGDDSVKNSLYISEFALDEAGTYGIGVPVNSNYLFKAEVTELSGEEAPAETDVITLEAVAGETYTSEIWTAPADGVLTITVTSEEGAGYKVYRNDECLFLGYSLTHNESVSYDVVAGDSYYLEMIGRSPEAWTNCDATIHYSFDFVAGGAAKEAYIISEQTITEAGTHTVTMEQGAEVTVVAISPLETGYYTVSVPEGALIANCGGGSWYITPWNSVEPATTVEWVCKEAGYWADVEVDTGKVDADKNPIYETVNMFIEGQSLMLGIVSDSETVEVTVTKTADYVNEEIPLQEYVNKATLSQFEVPEGAVIGGYVNVYGDTHTAVLGTDGYYHLDSADGPVLLVDLDYLFRLTDALRSDRPVMYAYVTENGVVVEKWDVGNAVVAYEAVCDGNYYYPLTEDLIFFYSVYAKGNGVIDFVLSEGYNADCAWMFACLTMTLPGSETPDDPDAELGTEENPIVIDSLPYDFYANFVKDAQAEAGIYYLYTAEKDGIIEIYDLFGDYNTGTLSVVTDDGWEMLTESLTGYAVKAGETILLCHWTLWAGEYDLTLQYKEETEDPEVPSDADHVLDATEDLESMAASDENLGATIVVDDYFTVILSNKTKIDGSNKTFEDGYVASQRINFGGKTQVKNDMLVNSIQFTTSAAASVKIWWVSGGDGRTMAIYDAEGNVILTDGAESIQNELYITEFALDAAGTYYIGVPEGNNYVFKVEVSEEAASTPDDPDVPEAPESDEWSGVDVPVTVTDPITIVFTPETNGTLVVSIANENWALYIEEEFSSSAYWSDTATSPISEKLTAGVTYTITLYAYDGVWDHIDGTLTYDVVFNAAVTLPVDGTLVDGDNHMELPADDEDGLVRYEYIATETGTLYFVVTYVGWDDKGTGVYDDDTDDVKNDFNGMTALSVNGVVLDGYYYGSVEVVEGQRYIIEWADTVTWNDVNGWEATLNLSYTDELVPVVGTADMPVELNRYYVQLPMDSIAIAPGTTAYYELVGFSGMTFTITGENAYAIVTTSEWDWNLNMEIVTEVRYDAVNGVVEIPITGWGAYNVQIGNAGDTKASFQLNAYYPVGSMENPDTDMNIGNNKVDIAEGSMYYYQWTAPCNGTLTITFSGKNWDYVVHNLTAGSYGEWNNYYNDPQVPTISVPISAGDVIEIQVATLEIDEFENTTFPAATIVFTAEFAYDHELGEGVHHDASCGQDAYTEYTCAICGETYVEAEEGTALEHNFVDGKCEHCGAYDYILGDVNGDGKINIFDANLIAAAYNEIKELDADQLAAADVNGDGVVNIFDANLIAALFNEVIEAFPEKG